MVSIQRRYIRMLKIGLVARVLQCAIFRARTGKHHLRFQPCRTRLHRVLEVGPGREHHGTTRQRNIIVAQAQQGRQGQPPSSRISRNGDFVRRVTRVDERRVGLPHRYGYAAHSKDYEKDPAKYADAVAAYLR